MPVGKRGLMSKQGVTSLYTAINCNLGNRLEQFGTKLAIFVRRPTRRTGTFKMLYGGLQRSLHLFHAGLQFSWLPSKTNFSGTPQSEIKLFLGATQMIFLRGTGRPAKLGQNAQLAIGLHLLIGSRHARGTIGEHQNSRRGTHGSLGD